MGVSNKSTPVTVEHLSALAGHERLTVLVDGAPAEMFIADAGFSDKVVLQFAEPHSEFGPEFATKYYEISEPGVLSWGHDGRTFSVTIAP